MEITVKSANGDTSMVSVADTYLDRPYNEVLVHQVLTAYLANRRVGTKAQKTRSEVSGGGKKPWRQKGTGRARAGTIRSPLWRAGGVTFAAKPRSFEKKVNKKSYRAAISVVLSELNRQERLSIVDKLSVDEPKTKAFLNTYGDELAGEKHGKTYFVDEALDMNFVMSARNLPLVSLSTVSDLSFVGLVESDKVVITQSALKKLEGVDGE